MAQLLLLAPHNDDENLFASFTIQREKPLVLICTDGYIQGERGDPITAEQRREESQKAADLLGYDVEFLGIKDTELSYDNLMEALKPYKLKAIKVYAPAVQGGNKQHDLVSEVADKVFGHRVTHYTTYTPTELWTKGNIEIKPTEAEIELKNKALDCYVSQINLNATAPHFESVRGKSEYYE